MSRYKLYAVDAGRSIIVRLTTGARSPGLLPTFTGRSMRFLVTAFLLLTLPASSGLGGLLRAQAPPANPRLLPDISLVGDLIFDLSRRGSTQEDGSRFGVREIELQLVAPVDPYFRGDVLLAYSDAEGVAVEQALLATTALPWHLEVTLGRFFLPIGKQNLMHRESLHTIEYPWVLQRFLSPEALKGTGIQVSRVFAPLGFYQELLLTATDRFGGGEEEDLVVEQPANQALAGLGYGARLRNYWDLTPNANIEVSGSFATGKGPQPLAGEGEINAANARRTLVGADVTYRWRPLGQGLYKSIIVQAEWYRSMHERSPALPEGFSAEDFLGPTRAFSGGYLFARYQLTRRTYLGARGDLLQDPETDGRMQRAASAYWQFYPSEFSKLLLGFERVMPQDDDPYHRLILQAVFAIGPHRPHPF